MEALINALRTVSEDEAQIAVATPEKVERLQREVSWKPKQCGWRSCVARWWTHHLSKMYPASAARLRWHRHGARS